MFEPNASWSLPGAPVHGLRVVGEVHEPTDPMSCTNELQRPGLTPDFTHGERRPPVYAWTDLTYLLHRATVSAGATTSPRAPSPTATTARSRCADCRQNADDARNLEPAARTSSTVQQDGQLGNITPARRTSSPPRAAARCPRSRGSSPNGRVSEHPPALVSDGQTYVTRLINAVMREPRLELAPRSSSPGTTGAASTTTSCRRRSTATATACACPGWSSARTRGRGYIDHQTLSFDAYVKFIEDDFLGGQRLDPRTDGRPDPRPDVRENGADPRRPGEGLRLHPGAAPSAGPQAKVGKKPLSSPSCGRELDEEEQMKASRHTRLMKWMAVVGAGAAVAATSAQAGGPPPDPGWLGVPHCTVPNIEGKLLAARARACTARCVESWRRCAGARWPRATPC